MEIHRVYAPRGERPSEAHKRELHDALNKHLGEAHADIPDDERLKGYKANHSRLITPW